jgi:protein-L-isoaspartate(D-aspartate) O-methyltransferase
MSNAALNMTLGQLYTNKIQNPRLLEAITSTPRENFVPPQFAKSAYSDAPLPYGSGRFMLAPLTTAEMLSLAQISSTDNVLIIGSGLGYTVALTSTLAAMVMGIDSDAALTNSARVLLAPYAPKARVAHAANLTEGYDAHAPYDAIIIEGAVEHIPDTLFAQLRTGGRLVTIAPISTPSAGVCGQGRITLLTHTGSRMDHAETIECAAPLLPDFAAQPAFTL